jgi:small nuclear ribonucleoprotein (snRNP)-like protein
MQKSHSHSSQKMGTWKIYKLSLRVYCISILVKKIMAQGPAAQRFFKELITLVNTPVRVLTDYKKVYKGVLKGYDPSTFNLALEMVIDAEENRFDKVFILGSHVLEITPTEKPFDLKALSEDLNRVFPNGVKLNDDAHLISVLNKIKVTKDGVEGPTGPVFDRAKQVYEQFMAKIKK